jgi:enoyl-CoA hydratase/carnithine racemase
MSSSNKKYKEILTKIVFGNVYTIVLNRPQKKNALNTEVKNKTKRVKNYSKKMI